jgi:hypothetical protein
MAGVVSASSAARCTAMTALTAAAAVLVLLGQPGAPGVGFEDGVRHVPGEARVAVVGQLAVEHLERALPAVGVGGHLQHPPADRSGPYGVLDLNDGHPPVAGTSGASHSR